MANNLSTGEKWGIAGFVALFLGIVAYVFWPIKKSDVPSSAGSTDAGSRALASTTIPARIAFLRTVPVNRLTESEKSELRQHYIDELNAANGNTARKKQSGDLPDCNCDAVVIAPEKGGGSYLSGYNSAGSGNPTNCVKGCFYKPVGGGMNLRVQRTVLVEEPVIYREPVFVLQQPRPTFSQVPIPRPAASPTPRPAATD